jgi:hypothetical protein
MEYPLNKRQISAQNDDQVRFSLLLERPSSEELRHYDRAGRVQRLRENSEARKRELVDWLQQQHVQQSVTRISKPNTMNILFVDAPRTLENLLKRAPGIKNVAVVRDLDVLLLTDDDE